MMHYNPLDSFYKSKIGAVLENDKITFRIKGDFSSAIFCCKRDGQDYAFYQMQKTGDYFEIEKCFSSGLYFYHFECDGRFLAKNAEYLGEFVTEKVDFQLTVYEGDYFVPSWVYGGIIYQIFPDRFYRGENEKIIPQYKVLHEKWDEMPIFLPNEQGEIINNDFFGGDIKGIIQKLDYIKSLGVNIIYLNPIFKAFSNHRYDTGDYMQIDDMLGDLDDFKLLIKKAKELGIQIVLDGVFNHTGDDSLYFNKYNRYDSVGAYQDKNSRYYSWYNFNDYPNKYESWWGIKTLPAINESNDDYIEFITGKDGVIEYYTKLGIGGWRLDVVDELPSDFVKRIRDAVKRNNQNAVIIGEVWEDATNKISYGNRREYFQGKELDSVMNYPLKNAILEFAKYGNTNLLSHTIKEQIDHYPHQALHALMNILSTHDTIRLLSNLSGESIDGKTKTELSKLTIKNENFQSVFFKLKVATLLQYTLMGVPTIYYGDEVGMQGYTDPLNRQTFPWGNENKNIYNWYLFLSSLRKNYSAFTCGSFEEIYRDNGAYIYKRFDENSEILIAINISNDNLCLDFDGNLLELLTNKVYNDNYELNKNTIAVFVNV